MLGKALLVAVASPSEKYEGSSMASKVSGGKGPRCLTGRWGLGNVQLVFGQGWCWAGAQPSAARLGKHRNFPAFVLSIMHSTVSFFLGALSLAAQPGAAQPAVAQAPARFLTTGRIVGWGPGLD